MQVFKLFFRMLISYKGVIMVYALISFVLAFVMTGNNSPGAKVDESEVLKETSIRLAIIDRDGGTLGPALVEYAGRTNEMIEIADDEDAIVNELYWRAVDYVLVIPEGYERSLIEGEALSLQSMSTPGTYQAAYFESQLDLYMSKIKTLIGAGLNIEEAEKEVGELSRETCKVSLASFVNENKHDAATVFLSFVPYMFITLCMGGMGTVLMRFNDKEVSARMECSATPLWKRTLGFICGTLAYGVILYAAVLICVGIVSEGGIYSDSRLPYFLINLFAMLLLGLSFGFLVGIVAKGNNTVTGMLNIVSISLCFLGGVFVPREFFGESVLKVARLVPTYWYIENNELIGALNEVTPAFQKAVFSQAGVVLSYAVAIFALTVVIIYQKRQGK